MQQPHSLDSDDSRHVAVFVCWLLCVWPHATRRERRRRRHILHPQPPTPPTKQSATSRSIHNTGTIILYGDEDRNVLEFRQNTTFPHFLSIRLPLHLLVLFVYIAMRFLLLLTLFSCGLGFIPRHFNPSSTATWRCKHQYGATNQDDFDGREFEEALKSIGPAMRMKMVPADDQDISNMRNEQVFRNYPFDNDYSQQLPILPDCNNYYSGKYGDFTWHQNADQVYVYIPIAEEISKRDVDVKFEALAVTVNIDGQQVTKFDTLERIIPDGSFWVFETDKDGKKYLLLDLEKRLRMINWKNIFGEPPKAVVGESENRKKMLESLFAANKGMSKLTGKEPETIGDMKMNQELMEMLNRDVSDRAERVGGDDEHMEEEGIEVEVDSPELFDVQKLVKQAADKFYGKDVIDTTADETDNK